jgi:two-component system invasion response regulator UvrY
VIKVYIIDDHEIMREGLKTVLRKHSDVQIIGDSGNSHKFFSEIPKSTIDVVVLDITLKGEDGLDVLRIIKQQYPKVRVLMLSMHPEERFAVRAIRSGASGYVDKQGASDELVDAIRKVARGEKYITPSLAQRLATEVAFDSSKPPHETLTDREFQIMRLFAQGKTSSEIAKELSISTNTVTTHRSKILEKMRVRTTAELVHYALEHHLVD